MMHSHTLASRIVLSNWWPAQAALDGRLKKAPRLKGIEGFRAADNGLVAMEVDTWGQLVFVRMAPQREGSEGAH